jgi:AraC-like DNA-binding protein
VNPDKLVDDYLSAWNRHDVEGVLAFLHPGASYFDAFWRECCVGRDLARYFHASFQEEVLWYQRIGDLMVTEHSIVYRYTAHECVDASASTVVFNGAEILTLRDDRILSISNYYCDPSELALAEIARLSLARHGETKYANAGLPAIRFLRFRKNFSKLIYQDRAYLDASLSRSSFAARVGCSVDHLDLILLSEYGTNFDDFVDECRVKFASELLVEMSCGADIVSQVASRSGFRSSQDLTSVFHKHFSVIPEDYPRDREDR